MPGEVEKLVNAALLKLHKSGLEPGTSIQPELFQASFKSLLNAVSEGWGEVRWGRPDMEFVRQLLKSAQFFAARKTMLQTSQLLGILVDSEKGTIRSFREFKKLSRGIIGNYNKTWLETEYVTALASARNAKLWTDFESEADLYPNVEYLRTSSPAPREQHLKFVGTILPLNHPWWTIHMPPSAWGCQCSVRNTDADTNKAFTDEEIQGLDIEPTFRNNPGLSRDLFNVKATKYAQKTDFITDAAVENELKTRILPDLDFFIPGYRFKNGGSLDVHPGVPDEGFEDNLKIAGRVASEGKQVKMLSTPDTLEIDGIITNIKTL